MKHCQITGIAVAALLLAGCSFFAGKKAEPEKRKPTSFAPKLVGRIASIPADKRFVLIQSYGSWKIGQGALLTTRGPEERSANLLVTGESLGQFAAADVQSGVVEIGDAVYSHHTPKPSQPSLESSTSPIPPQDQKINPAENVQKNN